MALKVNIDLKKIPPGVKAALSFVPGLIIAVIVAFVLILPKNKEIKALEIKIEKQETEKAKSQSKAMKLPELTSENERLKRRLDILKEQLPEEKEVSSFLKQVSELAIKSGLKILLWRPEQRKTHSSGIVYEIPVKVDLEGSYHNLGYFFSSITKLSRIVNISDIKLSNPKTEKNNEILTISFTATTFSAIPEGEIGKGPAKGK
jgi:type IV pilus assembly protein PilO